MSDWSDRQPPAWEGPEIGSTQPSGEPLPPAPPMAPPAAPQPARGPMKLGQLLTLTWEWTLARFKAMAVISGVGMVLGIVAGVAVVYLLIQLSPPSTEALAIINGDITALGLDPENPSEAALEALGAALGQALVWLSAISLVVAIPQFWMTAAAAQNFIAHARGEQMTAATALRTAPWLRLVAANLVAGLAILAAYLPGMVAIFAVPNEIGITLGLMLMLVATVFVVWFALGLLPITGIIVAERLSPAAAVRRSLKLARGSRGQMLGATLIVGILVSIATSIFSQASLLLPATGVSSLYVTVVTTAVTAAVAVPFSTATATLIYLNQRMKKEPDAAAELFK